MQTGPREDQTERVRLKVEIAVVSIDYDGAAECRCKGTCTTENQYIPLGAFHTIVLEPGHDLKLTKDVWDVLDIKRLDDAAELSLTADLAVVLITEGLAHVCLVGRSSTVMRAKVCIIAHVWHFAVPFFFALVLPLRHKHIVAANTGQPILRLHGIKAAHT